MFNQIYLKHYSPCVFHISSTSQVFSSHVWLPFWTCGYHIGQCLSKELKRDPLSSAWQSLVPGWVSASNQDWEGGVAGIWPTGFLGGLKYERGRTQAASHEIHDLGTGLGIGVKPLLGEDVSGSLRYQLRGRSKFQTLLWPKHLGGLVLTGSGTGWYGFGKLKVFSAWKVQRTWSSQKPGVPSSNTLTAHEELQIMYSSKAGWVSAEARARAVISDSCPWSSVSGTQ